MHDVEGEEVRYSKGRREGTHAKSGGEEGKLRKKEATETKLGKTGIREGGPRGSSKDDGGNTYGRRWRGRNTESKEQEEGE